MKFYIAENGFIVATGEDDSTAPDMPGAVEAAELFRCYPTAPEGYAYRLKEDLTWVPVALPAGEPEEETGTEDEEENDG